MTMTPEERENMARLDREREVRGYDDVPPRPSRRRYVEDEPPAKKSGGSPLLILIVAIAVSLLFTVYWTNSITAPLVKKADLDTKVAGLTTQITALQTSVTPLQNLSTTVGTLTTQVATATDKATLANQTIAGIQTNMGSYIKSDQINAVNNSLTAVQNSLNDLKTQMTTYSNSNNELASKITALQTQLTADEAKITALQTAITPTSGSGSSSGSGSGSSSVNSDITGARISVSVTDDGSLQSDNSSLGEVKIVLENTTTNIIDDIILSLTIFFDGSVSANQTIASSTYGTWSVRSRSTDEIEIRGKLSRLDASQTRRVYVDITSWGVLANSTTGAREVSYLDTSTSDLQVIDWAYAR